MPFELFEEEMLEKEKVDDLGIAGSMQRFRQYPVRHIAPVAVLFILLQALGSL